MHTNPPRGGHLSSLRFVFGALVLFVLGAVGHNLLSGLLGVEEPFFFLLAVLVAPILLVYGIVLAIANRAYPDTRSYGRDPRRAPSTSAAPDPADQAGHESAP